MTGKISPLGSKLSAISFSLSLFPRCTTRERYKVQGSQAETGEGVPRRLFAGLLGPSLPPAFPSDHDGRCARFIVAAMSIGGSSATGHSHSQQPSQQLQQPQLEDQEDLFPPDNFSMVDAGIYRSERECPVHTYVCVMLLFLTQVVAVSCLCISCT